MEMVNIGSMIGGSKGVNKIKCSSSHEICVRWCLNILRAVHHKCHFSVVLRWLI